MAETTKYIKRLPDHARIDVSITDQVLEVESKAVLTGEMVNISDAYHDEQAIEMVVQEMLNQIKYEDGGFPPSSYLDITINTGDNMQGNKISGELLRKDNSYLEFFNTLVDTFGYQEEVEVIIPKSDD